MKRLFLLAVASLATAQAGGAAGLTDAGLLKLRRANLAALGTRPALLQTGGMCRGLLYFSESKGGSVSFPVGRASPLYVADRGIYYAFDFPNGQARRLWCMGSSTSPTLLKGKHHSPFWTTAAANLQGKGRQVGQFPDVAGPQDIYWNFAGEQYASRVDDTGKEICSGLFKAKPDAPYPPAVRWQCQP